MIYETLTMYDSRYPPTVLWAGYGRNDVHTHLYGENYSTCLN
jgi:hypothetical protein